LRIKNFLLFTTDYNNFFLKDSFINFLFILQESARQISEGLLPDGSRLHACLEQLQDIVGPGMPRERLVQVVLAADFDVNRALNFIFSSPNPSPSLS
jgi:hypothetical protein